MVKTLQYSIIFSNLVGARKHHMQKLEKFDVTF